MKERKEKYFGFFHGYLTNPEKIDKFGDSFPDNSTRAVGYGIAHLLNEDEIDFIAISIGSKLAGPNVRRLRALKPNTLKEDKDHPENDKIKSSENTVTTGGEIREIIKILKNDPTCTVISVCICPHKDRITKIMELCTFLRPDIRYRWHILSFEEILQEAVKNGDHPVFHQAVLTSSENWEDIKSFKKQEEGVAKLLDIPLVGSLGVYIFPELIPDKSKIIFQKWLLSKLRGKKDC